MPTVNKLGWPLVCLRCIAWAGITAIGSAGVAALVIYCDRARGPFWEKYQKVRLDMTGEEVVETLGPPALEEYPGGSLGGFCLAWFEGGQTIAVDFDIEGRVTEKRFRLGRNLWWVRERAKGPP
jgi:hypothetical protein